MNIKIKVSPNEIEVELLLVDIPIIESVIECVVRLFDGANNENPEPEIQNELA